MAIAFVQDATTTLNGTSTLTLTLGAGTISGHLLVLAFGNGGVTPETVSSISGGGTWAKRESASLSDVDTEIWECPNCSGGVTTVTVTLSAAASGAAYGATVMEFSGVTAVSPFDVGSGSTGTSTTVQVPSETPGNANELFIAAMAFASSTTISSGPTNSFTTPTSDTRARARCAYLIASDSAAHSTAWTIGASVDWGTAAAVYKVSLGGNSGGFFDFMGRA